MHRRALVTLCVAVPYTAGGLWLDRYVGHTGQLLLGLLTAAVLAALLVLHSRAVRLQTLAVVGIATLGEVVGSLIWGLYSYRLDNLPAFVPPGHGLVFLCGISLAMLFAQRPAPLLGVAIAGACAWGVAGLALLPALDIAGAIGCAFLVVGPGADAAGPCTRACSSRSRHSSSTAPRSERGHGRGSSRGSGSLRATHRVALRAAMSSSTSCALWVTTWR